MRRSRKVVLCDNYLPQCEGHWRTMKVSGVGWTGISGAPLNYNDMNYGRPLQLLF